jgi:hypothetical protein
MRKKKITFWPLISKWKRAQISFLNILKKNKRIFIVISLIEKLFEFLIISFEFSFKN